MVKYVYLCLELGLVLDGHLLNKLINVAQSIQALVLCKNPLYNEPGYDKYKETDKIIRSYTNQMYILSSYFHIFKMIEQNTDNDTFSTNLRFISWLF